MEFKIDFVNLHPMLFISAHNLNLALVDCVKGVADASFFLLLEALYVFMSTTKVHVLFMSKLKELHPDRQIR